MILIHAPIGAPTDANLSTGLVTYPTGRFLAGNVFALTVTELFQWISSLVNSSLPPNLIFEFRDIHSNLERRVAIPQGDSKLLEAVKTIAWEHFREIASLDPTLAHVHINIIPVFSVPLEGTGENIQQQLQQLHSANTTSNIPSDQQSYLPSRDQSVSSSASGSTHRPFTTKPRGPPPFGPPPQSQSSSSRALEFDTINSHGGPPKSAPNSISHNENTPERNISNASNNTVGADAPSNPNPQRQLQEHQPAQLTAPNDTKTNTSTTPSTAKIVIRIQIDGHGRLSRSYDKSTLNTRTTSARFFAWFAEETGHMCSGKLRFDFKDALPAKSSVIAAGNDDHFDLMVCDIKRKFERAKEYTPDMNEFCIVVTDPLWYSGDEDEDGDG
jgi:hypothetical protein